MSTPRQRLSAHGDKPAVNVWHINLSSLSRAVLFRSEAALRTAVHAIQCIARGLILFCVVDDHVHVVLACDPALVPRIRGALVRALSRLSGQRLISHVTPVESRAHLNRLVDYLLRQVRHHRLPAHPGQWTGSCYADLVGARHVQPLLPRLRELVPRLCVEDIHRAVGLEPARVVPADDATVQRAGAHRVRHAAAAAVAADPALADHTLVTVRAKRVAVHLAEQAGLGRSELVRVLACTRQRVSQLARQPVDPVIVRAARLQLTLDALVTEAMRARRTG